MKKWLVALTCVGMLAVSAMNAMGGLIISQYYEGTSNNKWIEIYNPGPAVVDMGAGGYRLGLWSGTNRLAWKTSVAPTYPADALTNTIAAGATFLYAHSNAVLPSYAVATMVGQTAWFNGDDSVVLYTGETYAFGNVVDAIGFTNTTVAFGSDKNFVRTNTLTVGVNTDFNETEWATYTLTAVENAAAGTNERLGYHSTVAAMFGVTFSKTNGFAVEQGASDSVTATAANGTAPYSYSWSSTLGSSYYTTNAGVFAILATAPLGGYTSTVVATDSAAQNVTNSLNFSVVPPATKYAITITPPTNGTVTTTPATEAAAGVTVTINATPAGGYAAGAISVVDADSAPVTVNGTTFTMPAKTVTVTVPFVVHVGSALIISEVADPSGTGGGEGRFIELYNTGGSSIDLAAGQWFIGRQANGTSWANIALTGTVGAAATYVVAYSATSFPAAYPSAPAPNQVNGNISGTGDDGYFLYSGGGQATGTLQDAYGVLNEDGTGMPWEYTDSRAVRQSAVTAGNQTWTASEWTIASAAYAAMTPGVHPDGAAVFGVTFDKANGFAVNQGTSSAVTATAANGTAPYTYGWSSTMGGTYYTAVSNVFTILATAPVGAYTTTVVATDSAAQSVTNRIGFSVVTPYAITITPPTNGTVTTTPATEAVQGATVTINATPSGGYAVGAISVVGADSSPVTVNGNTFVMPAQAVTVTVPFVADLATLPIAESHTNTLDWTTLAGWSGVSMSTYTDGDMSFNLTADALTVQFDGTPGVLSFDLQGRTSTAGTAPMQFLVEESADGAAWTQVASLTDGAVSTSVASFGPYTLLAASRYVRWTYVNKYAFNIGLNNVGITSGGPAVFGVTVNRTNGFVVAEGASDAITATAANGTAPYGYSWSSTLGTSYRTTNANVFTILATAPTGSYSATVTATDSTNATAQKTVTFRVAGADTNAPAVNIAGSLSGTVGVAMNLTITLTNGTAADWVIELKDPDSLDDYTYGWMAPAFSLTPAKTGTYQLTATAVDGSAATIAFKTVSLTVSAAGTDPVIPPFALALNGTGNFLFGVPSGYAFSRLLGADTSLNDKSLVWSNLTEGVHYSVSGTNVTILTIPASRQILRIGVTPSP